MSAKQERAARSAAAAILGRRGGQVVSEKKREHLRSIARKGAAARWAKRAEGGK